MFNKLKFIVVLFCMFLSHAAYAVPVTDVMEIHVVPNVGSTPVTVNLDNVYTNAIPVCTYNIPDSDAPPSVVRINSISSTSISIKLGLLEDAAGAFAVPGNVHCIIVEEGLHDVNGTPIEARTVLSTNTVGRNTSPNWTTGNNNGWLNNLENITSLITHPFSEPVVLGQVITSNDPLASIYYANNCTSDRRDIPFDDTNSICVGKHISKEVGTRVDETIGVIIADTTTTTGASGATGGFRAGTTPRSIAGVDGRPPYSTNTVETYSVGVASQSGEKGGDGAWAVLYGPDPLANSQINLAIDESEINNNNRFHTTEIVNYLVVTVPTITLEKNVVGGGPKTADDFTLSFSGVTNNSGIAGSTNVTSFPVRPGTYTLSESTLAQYNQTGLSCNRGSLNGNELQLSPFDYATCTFTNTYDPSSNAGVDISGNVFEDLNSNGVKSGAEDWSNAISVFVNIVDTQNPTTVLQSVQVNPGNGDYTFPAVPPGEYELVLSDSQVNVLPVAPDEWIFLAPANGSQTITVASANVTGQNFGLFHAPILNLTKTTTTPVVINDSTGTVADYQIVLTNEASLGGDATGVQISDILPTGFIYDASSAVITTPATGSCLVAASRTSTVNPANGASGTIAWGLWTIPAGCQVIIDFSANIPTTVADATNDSSVSVTTSTSPATINNFEGTLSNDENVTVTSAVLAIAKESLIKNATANSTTNYRITVNNNGTATATDVVITDALPQPNNYFTYSSTASITGLHTRTTTNNPAAGATSPVWGTFDIPAGGSVILEFAVDINGATPDAFYQNSASVTSTNAKTITNYDGSIAANNTDDVEVATGLPTTDLTITNTGSLSSATPGGSISYSIVVHNTASPEGNCDYRDAGGANNGWGWDPIALESCPPLSTDVDVVGASVTNIFDPNIFDVANVTWSCAITTGSGQCATPGPTTGNINTTIDLTANSIATFTVTTAPILSNATNSFGNTAVVDPPSGMTDSDGNNNLSVHNAVLVPEGDLIITKDNGVDSAVAGLDTTYSIVVSNAGPSDVIGATVNDTFDSTDVNVANVTWTCAIDGGSVGACGAVSGTGDISTTLDLTAGSSATFTAIVPVLEAAVAPLENTATVTAPSGFTESNNSNNSAVDSDNISAPQADLEITAITSNATPAPGENFTYTLTLQNNGPSGATNVSVTNTYPANSFNFVSAVAQQGAGDTRTFSNNGASLSWTIPFLPSGNSATLAITARINATGFQTTSAEVISLDQDDPDSPSANGIASEDDFDSVDIDVGGTVVNADLRISKTDGLTTAAPGSAVTYSIVVTNDASSLNDVTGATVEDIFDPAYFDIANVSWTCGITTGSGLCASPGPVLGNINNAVVDLTIGSSATFTVTAPVLSTASGTLSNTATVTAPPGVTETDSLNNTALDNNTALAPVADLSITTTVDNPTPNIGDLVTFAIEVTSAGPSNATNVSVRDILPAGYTFNLAGTSATQGSYDNATGDWTIGTLRTIAPVQTLFLAATVNSTGSYDNNAQIWTSGAVDNDSTPANNVVTEDDYASASVTIRESDLSITHVIDEPTPVPGANVTFTLTVNNTGPNVANAVIIEDRLPAAFTYVSSNIMSSNGDETATPCLHAGGVVTCQLNSVDPLIDDVIEVVAFSNPTTEGTTQTNVVEIVSATEFDPDSVHGNGVLTEDDQASIDIAVSSADQANLSLTISADVTEPSISQNVEYTIVVSNAGPATAENVEIVDTLPAGLDYVSVSVTDGADSSESCSLSGQALSCDLGSITVASPKTVVLTAKVQAGQEGNTITNSVEVTKVDNSDPNSIKNNGVTTEDDYAAVDITVSIAPTYIVSGSIYADANANSTRDGSEDWTTGTPVFINLIDNTGTIAQSVQVLAGNGDFSLPGVFESDYTVVVTDSATNINPVAPVGWVFVEPNTGSSAFSVSGSDIELPYFGLYNGSVLSGVVFNDNGASGGVANNGNRDGGETGLANISVVASDAATSSVTYSSATTDVNGNYTFLLPSSLDATNIAITQTNSANYISTGADVGNTFGTYVINSDTITFTNATGTTYNGVNFGDVANSVFTVDNHKAVAAGDTALHPHVFTPGTGGAFTLSSTTTTAISGWSETFFLDSACNGVIDSGDAAITSPINVVAGEQVCILQEQTTSFATPSGTENVATVTASFTYANSSIVNTYTRTNTTVINGGATIDDLSLVKSVDKATATPGELLTYTITYNNISVDPMASLEINDSIPAYTTFVSASCGNLAQGLTNCNITDPGVGNTGPLAWTMSGALLAGGQGVVSFVVRVD